MKRFLAAMAMLFVCVLAIWVAFRLAPETWAMIAGVVFGLVATLPMCAIVVLMLLRGHGQERQPAERSYYPPPQQPIVVLNAEPGPYGQYWVEPPRGARQLPAGRPAARQSAAPPRPFVDRSQGSYGYPPPVRAAQPWDAGEAEDYEEAEDAAEPYGAWERPAPARDARILGW